MSGRSPGAPPTAWGPRGCHGREEPGAGGLVPLEARPPSWPSRARAVLSPLARSSWSCGFPASRRMQVRRWRARGAASLGGREGARCLCCWSQRSQSDLDPRVPLCYSVPHTFSVSHCPTAGKTQILPETSRVCLSSSSFFPCLPSSPAPGPPASSCRLPLAPSGTLLILGASLGEAPG